MREKNLAAIISFLFVIVLASLFYTQVIRHGYYLRLSRNNSIRVVPIKAPRGDIFDKNGVKIVGNRLCFDATVVYSDLRERERLELLLSETLGVSPSIIAKALAEARLRPQAYIKILRNIEKDKAIMLEEAAFDLDGFEIETSSRRDYIYGNAGCHIFGYLGEVTEEELESAGDYGYRQGDLVGRSGLEKYYEIYLAGTDGGTQIEVDSKGRKRRVLGLKEPSSGKSIHLTIDIDLQKRCDELLGDRKGAVIVMDPRTGEVLALASHPAFDPAVFVQPEERRERARLLNDVKGHALFDRAVSGIYPPGSVFKVATAASALETKKISSSRGFSCSGVYILGKGKFNCWKEEGHGAQNVTDALMNSCNVVFYQVGRLAGVDALEHFAKIFGFGKTTGIDLPDESRGLVPGRLWKRLSKKDAWYEGDTVNYAIGQGYLLVTPIQVLEMMSVIANGGYLVRPFLARRIEGEYEANVVKRKTGLKEGTIDVIKRGLYKAVNGENGTARRAGVEGLAIAGKTGTAENPQGKTHAWFSGFAPFDDPKICLVVFLEHGGKGGLESADIASGIFAEAKAKGYFAK